MGEIELEIMKLFEKYDACDELYWDAFLEFYVHCNDFFAWACADCEHVNGKEDLELLKECFKDSEYHGVLLYCAKKRKMRPQGAYYKYLKKDEKLFDACGPERDPKEAGNTPKP